MEVMEEERAQHAKNAGSKGKAGMDWNTILIALVSTLVLLILCWRSNAAVHRINDEINQEALLNLARINPEAVCIEAAPTLQGIVNHNGPSVGCLTGAACAWQPLHYGNVSFAIEVMRALELCGAVDGFYDHRDLLAAMGGDAEMAGYFSALQSSPPGVAVPKPASGHSFAMVLRFLNDTVGENVTSTSFIPGLDITLVDEYPDWQPPGPFCSPLPDAAAPMDMVWRFYSPPGRYAVLLKLHQSLDTAGCLSRALAEHRLCGTNDSLLLVPFVPLDHVKHFVCTSTIDSTYWGEWSNFLTATINIHRTQFLGIEGNLNDLVGIYTGALAAIFGAAAILAACLFFILVALFPYRACAAFLRRAARGVAKEATDCWQACSKRVKMAWPHE